MNANILQTRRQKISSDIKLKTIFSSIIFASVKKTTRMLKLGSDIYIQRICRCVMLLTFEINGRNDGRYKNAIIHRKEK